MNIDSVEYIAPTPNEIRRLLKYWGPKTGVNTGKPLTGSEVGKLINVEGRQVRRYTSIDNPSKMPYAVLFTLIYKQEKVAISSSNWRAELKKHDIKI